MKETSTYSSSLWDKIGMRVDINQIFMSEMFSTWIEKHVVIGGNALHLNEHLVIKCVIITHTPLSLGILGMMRPTN